MLEIKLHHVISIIIVLVLSVVCNGIQTTALQGIIQSPEFPGVYPDQANCDWKITLPLGYQIELTFSKFDVENHDEVKCPYDYLKVQP